jgi:hypothetical protein
MAATSNSCFRLVDFEKSSSLKLLYSQLNQNLVGRSFSSFGKAVSEEEDFFLEINQSETRMACGGHVC